MHEIVEIGWHQEGERGAVTVTLPKHRFLLVASTYNSYHAAVRNHVFADLPGLCTFRYLA
jgi:hypothetical protein